MKTKRLVELFGIAGILPIAGFVLLSGQTRASGKTSAVTSPRSLYLRNCARCHGADGKAQTELGKKLLAEDISGGESVAKVIRTVTNGRGEMPSFKRRLTPAQIKAIASYVQKF